MVPIYLEEFEVCSPPDAWRVDYEKAVAGFRQWEHVGEDGIAFVRKVYKLIGMSPTRTFLPPWVNPQFIAKPEVSLDRAHDEAMVTVVGTARQLLQKAGVGPGDIDIVVTACSVYCPTPSMSALLVNQLGLRPDVLSYSLGGMGCSSGVLGLQLAQELLQVYRDKRALFVAAEMTTPACYTGTDKARYLANTLFRAGGAAALLTNHASAAHTAKYRMVATTRSHGAADDEAYGAVHFGPDKDGVNGLLLSNHLPKYAGKVLERCVRQIAPKIMTWGQYAEAATWYVKDAIEAHLSGSSTSKAGAGKDTYIPDFTRCIDHFAIHAGGYVVVKAIQESMKLPPAAVMSSMASLMDFGNTSVSLTWYAWAYCEAVQNVKRGHRVLQMGVGSGVKGAVVAWEALKDIPAGGHPAWAHLGGKPYTDADLPRSLMETPQTDAFLAKAMDQDRRP